MIKYLKQYEGKTFEELVNSLIWFDNPFKLKAIFAKLPAGDSRPYKVYSALLTQTGTNAPVATVLENTLGNITYSYVDAGLYYIISDSLFSEKTVCFIQNTTQEETGYQTLKRLDSNTLKLNSLANTIVAPYDSIIDNSSIEIRVYN